jgi:F420-non-reducing hydrogenase iron-sulfur subunit
MAKYTGKRQPLAAIRLSLGSVREMVIEMRPRSVESSLSKSLKHDSRIQITVFHCFNALDNTSFLDEETYDIRSIKLPCSSMTREVVLLRAFESGADAVVVLVCPEGSCRYLQGNLRTAKRVAHLKKLLDEIGIDGRRLNLYNIPHGDQSVVSRIIDKTISDLAKLGPNPAF